MNRRNFLVALLTGSLVAASLSGVDAVAMSGKHRTFDESIDLADVVLLGTVVAVSANNVGSDRRRIATFVELGNLEVLKGKVDGDTYELQLAGGVVGNRAEVYPGMPRFVSGERVALFVRGNTQSILPLVGLTSGLFRIAVDPASGQRIVLDSNYSPVVAIENTARSYSGKVRRQVRTKADTGFDTFHPISEADFAAAITAILRADERSDAK